MITLAGGAFEAREVQRQQRPADGERNGSCPMMRSQELARIVPPNQRYAYNVIVHVGMARYLRGMQREEIRQELRDEADIELSSGTVFNLCDRFLIHLEALHLARSPVLREVLQRDGYPLHLDTTCDKGSGGLFVCFDGWRGWVLWAERVPTENGVDLSRAVGRAVAVFGDPIATVRDLGDAGAAAVKPLHERGIPDLLCHYHFAAAVGKKLLDKPYSVLRGILRDCGVRSRLWTLLRELRVYEGPQPSEGRFGAGRVRRDLLVLVLWVLDGDGRKEQRFPFGLPHLDFAWRCRQVREQAEQWVPTPRTEPERRALRRLATLCGRVEQDPRTEAALRQLDEGRQVFDELRDVLRLTNGELLGTQGAPTQAELPALELNRLREMEKAADAYREELRDVIGFADEQGYGQTHHAIMLDYLERYGDGLFGHPALRDEDGSVRKVVERTNNPIEQFFGMLKHNLRRRVARAHLGRDLADQPAQAALVANLERPDYVRLLCGSLENLPAAFASLSPDDLAKVELVRTGRDTALVRRIRTLLDEQAASTEPDASTTIRPSTES